MLDKIMRLGKIVDLLMYNLVYSITNDDLAYDLFKDLVYRRLLNFCSFLIGFLEQTDNIGFNRRLHAALHGSFLE